MHPRGASTCAYPGFLPPARAKAARSGDPRSPDTRGAQHDKSEIVLLKIKLLKLWKFKLTHYLLKVYGVEGACLHFASSRIGVAAPGQKYLGMAALQKLVGNITPHSVPTLDQPHVLCFNPSISQPFQHMGIPGDLQERRGFFVRGKAEPL